METRTNEIKADSLPFVVLLALFTLFLLTRPPILLLFNPEPIGSLTPSDPWPAPIPTVRAPVRPPPLPASLSQTATGQMPAHWTEPLPVSREMDAIEAGILTSTNLERGKISGADGKLLLTPLAEDQTLGDIATRHSLDMVARDYMAHTSPDGDGPAQRSAFLHRRLFGAVGENVALYDSPDAPLDEVANVFMRSWMNSLGHRRNILRDSFDHIGVGCGAAVSPEDGMIRRRCTQLFATIYAMSKEDIPLEVTGGSPLPITLLAEPGRPTPTKILAVDLQTGTEKSEASLTTQGGQAAGVLAAPDAPGLYGLKLHVPSSSGGGGYDIVPGPTILVSPR
jgi:uncharacterized protein YkwD